MLSVGTDKVLVDHPIHFEQGWQLIQERGIGRLREIMESDMHGKISHQEFALIYTTVYNMCLQKSPQSFDNELYDKFVETIRSHLTMAKPQIFGKDRHGEFMLMELVQQYRQYKFFVKWLCQTFNYLDRHYVKRKHKLNLRQVATREFHDIIFTSVKNECLPIALELVERDRNGLEVDRSILHDFVSMFVEVGGKDCLIYKKEFEMPYLNATTEYYLVQSEQMLQSLNCAAYLSQAEKYILAEKERERDYLDHSTHNALMKRLYAVLLVDKQQRLLETENGLYRMIANEQLDDLHRLYHLYSFAPSTLPFIASVVLRRIVHEGTALVEKCLAPNAIDPSFIPQLIALYIRHETIIKDCFKNHADFSKALKDGYMHIVNMPLDNSERSMQELLSTYCDILMRRDTRMPETQLMETLDKIVRIFAYINDKDIFLEFYRKQMAKRLLTGKSADEHAEKTFITKLKLRCGAQFTSKLEGMINDMDRSIDHKENFTTYLRQSRRDLAYEFNPQVLTSGFWPNFRPMGISLPKSMMHSLETFESYFSSKHEKRTLTWLHQLGTVVVKGHFASGKTVSLEVSTLQACVLLILNQIASIRIVDITRMLKVDPLDIKRQLKPLCSKKFPVLLKQPPSGYDAEHCLSMNEGWNPQKLMFKIPTGHKITVKERQENSQTVEGDRKFMIEACIVRVMKTRKRLEHSQLVAEVSSQLMSRFYPNPKQIKERIGDLIEREYLCRDANSPSVYLYV